MTATISRLVQMLGFLRRAPEDVADKVEELKASPGGQKLVALDQKAGRIYARVHATVWFVAALPLAGLGYLSWALASGWLKTTLVAVFAALSVTAVWYAVSHLRNPSAASEVLIEELEDRVRPARWALGVLRALWPGKSAAAE